MMSGYLIVAWLVGGKLTRAQVSLINVLFVFFQFCMVLGWSARWELAMKYFNLLASLDPDIYAVRNPAGLVIFATVMAVSIPGCLKFMWDIRHPKTE